MNDGQVFWHAVISPTNAKRQEGWDDAVVLDKDREWIETRILEPRRRGQAVSLSGRTYEWSEVERLKITVSEEPSDNLIARLKVKDAQSDVWAVGGPGYAWRAAFYANDVTDDLIDAPAGSTTEAGRAPSRVDRRKVMVVHGRDGAARRAMFDFLRALGLRPQEWAALVAATGSASPYVGEVLEKAFEEAAAVVVLFTPDDEAKLRDEHHGDDEPDHERELTPQARPNVLFEAGMALGVHPTRTVLVELGDLRPFSDVYGRHVVRLDGTEQPLREIARRLQTAGCDVDDSGDDWAAPDRFPSP